MKSSELYSFFLQLVRLGIGTSKDTNIPKDVEWDKLKILANHQGLNAVVLDGIERLPEQQRPPKAFLLEWIGETLQSESTYSLQGEVARDVAKLFYRNGIRTYVLKGAIISECYPKPQHRMSVDIDCFLLPENGDFDAWALGNDLVRNKGFRVNTDFYKNSSFEISGVNIENHQFFTPFRGNKILERLEIMLQSMMKSDKGEDKIEGTWLYRPPVMASALFLIEHAYSHFLHEGLTWRHVLDWMMFSKKHKKEIDWYSLDALIEEFGFKKFYDSYYRLGQYLIGEVQASSITVQDKRMLEDVWDDLDLHETDRGIKGKLALAGNTWRARWKYKHFAEISMIHALWIQVKGFLFIKEPKLG